MDPPSFFFSSSSFSSHPFLCKFFPYFLQSDNLSLSLSIPSIWEHILLINDWQLTSLIQSNFFFLHLTFLLRRGKENFRQMEKKILDSIIGPTNNYDSRIRPSGDNSTGDIGQYYSSSVHSWHSFTTSFTLITWICVHIFMKVFHSNTHTHLTKSSSSFTDWAWFYSSFLPSRTREHTVTIH